MRRLKTKSLFLSVLLLSLSVLLPAQTLHLDNLVLKERMLSLDIKMEQVKTTTLIQNLQEGLRAEIVFHIKLYKKSKDFNSLFGDQLLLELDPAHGADWDLFNDQYIIRATNGEIRKFNQASLFLNQFFHLANYQLELPSSIDNDDDVYLITRSELRTIKLVPPLTILTFIIPGTTVLTPWKKSRFLKIGNNTP